MPKSSFPLRGPSTRIPLSQKLGPLRRVVSEGVNEHGVATETLECGHTILRKSDIYGPTNAYRRRCRHCRDTRATDGEGAA